MGLSTRTLTHATDTSRRTVLQKIKYTGDWALVITDILKSPEVKLSRICSLLISQPKYHDSVFMLVKIGNFQRRLFRGNPSSGQTTDRMEISRPPAVISSSLFFKLNTTGDRVCAATCLILFYPERLFDH